MELRARAAHAVQSGKILQRMVNVDRSSACRLRRCAGSLKETFVIAFT
jgi:hypothetical protein